MAKTTVLGQTNRGYTPTTAKKKDYTSATLGLASAPITTATDMAELYGRDYSHTTGAAAPRTGVTSTSPAQEQMDYAMRVQPPASTKTPTNDGGNNGGGNLGDGGGNGGGSGSGSGSGSGTPKKSSAPQTNLVYEQAYIPTNDPAYMEALNALNNLTGAMPTYSPSYDEQLSDLYNRIIGRGPFNYDLNTDPFYQQYRNQAIDTGRLAMQDTMGQAAALTGGYGSSYGQSVGQQQYDAYLKSLNDTVPEFYDSAYNRWLNEGNQLEEQYALTQGLANDEYNRYRDQMSDYYDQLNVAANRENQLYNRGYQANSDANSATSANRDRLLNLMLTTGYEPTESDLKNAGMSSGEADAWRNYYAAQQAAAAASGGGGGGGSRSAKLDFSGEDINGAYSAYLSGGENGLFNYLERLRLGGADEDALEQLGQYISSAAPQDNGAKGGGANYVLPQTNQNSGGLTSTSSADDVLEYYRRMGWIK